MQFSRIGIHTLKITLSAAELSCRGLDFRRLDYGDSATRRLLFELLEEAWHRTGFAAEGRITLHLYGRKDGGCTLFAQTEKKTPDNTPYIYCLERQDELLAALRYLRETNTSASLYRGAEGYYFSLKEPNEWFCEFARPCRLRYGHAYLSEHTRRIF